MCVSNLMQVIEDNAIIMICEKSVMKYVGKPENIPPEYHGDTVKSLYPQIYQINIGSSIVSAIAIEVR